MSIPGVHNTNVWRLEQEVDSIYYRTADHRTRFLPADALWNLAMAFNVYLTLFRKKNAQQLKKLEWKYHIMCYGTQFIVAFIYLFIRTKDRGSIYGPATLWCWIDIEWVALRIATCYAPAWCCILVAFCIYVMAGREIFIKRRQLRAFSQAAPENHSSENPYTDFKTTEIQITSELATLNALDPAPVFLSPGARMEAPRTAHSPSGSDYKPYTVMIDSNPMTPREATMSPTGENGLAPSTVSQRPSASPNKSYQQQRNNRAAMEANAAAWGYTKVALLFFVSLLVTWVSPDLLLRIMSKRSRVVVNRKNFTGAVLSQPCIFTHPSRTRLGTIHVCFKCCPSTNGLLEFCHLHHYIVEGCEATVHGATTKKPKPFSATEYCHSGTQCEHSENWNWE